MDFDVKPDHHLVQAKSAGRGEIPVFVSTCKMTRSSHCRKPLISRYLQRCFPHDHPADTVYGYISKTSNLSNPQSRHLISTRRILLLLVFLLTAEIASGHSASPSLRNAYQNDFLIGVALNSSQVNGRNPKAAEIAALGLKVMITELHVGVLPSKSDIGVADISRVEKGAPKLDPFTSGLPHEVQQQLAERYAGLFRVFIHHKAYITRVTFWGLDDGQTWLNHFPIPGRTNHSLLFNRELLSKPAIFAVLKVGKQRKDGNP